MSDAQFRCWATSHVGCVRSHNEDRLVNRTDIGLWAVADGAGGHDAGEVASGLIAEALETLPDGLSAADLLAQVRVRIDATHAALRQMAAERGPQAMIASTVVVLLARDSHFACLWAGDSRIYVLRGGALVQLTRDHSLVQELVDAGAIAADAAESHPHANVITRAVGAGIDGLDLELEKVMAALEPGDRFLLCSDGLCKTLSTDDIAAILSRTEAGDVSAWLVQAALDRRVNDNVTAVVVDFLRPSVAPASADPPTDPESTLRGMLPL